MFNIQFGKEEFKWSQEVVQQKLEAIGQLKDKKVAWIQSNLSTSKSSAISRFIWTLFAKYFNCLRERLYGVNLEKSKSLLQQIGDKLDKNNEPLITVFNSAVEKFNQIAPHHTVTTVALPVLQEASEENNDETEDRGETETITPQAEETETEKSHPQANIDPIEQEAHVPVVLPNTEKIEEKKESEEEIDKKETPDPILKSISPPVPFEAEAANEFLANQFKKDELLDFKDNYKFRNATELDLSSATFPLTKETLEGLFDGCTGLKEVILPGSITLQIIPTETLRVLLDQHSKNMITLRIADFSAKSYAGLLTRLTREENARLVELVQQHGEDCENALLIEAINLVATNYGGDFREFMSSLLMKKNSDQLKPFVPALHSLSADNLKRILPIEVLTQEQLETLGEGMKEEVIDNFILSLAKSLKYNDNFKQNFSFILKKRFETYPSIEVFRELINSINPVFLDPHNEKEIFQLAKDIVDLFLADLKKFEQLCDSFKNHWEPKRKMIREFIFFMSVLDQFDWEQQEPLLNILFKEGDKIEALKNKFLEWCKDCDRRKLPTLVQVCLYQIMRILKSDDAEKEAKILEIYSQLRNLHDEEFISLASRLSQLCALDDIPLIISSSSKIKGVEKASFGSEFMKGVLKRNDQEGIRAAFECFWPLADKFTIFNPPCFVKLFDAIDSKMKFEEVLNALPDDLDEEKRKMYLSSLSTKFRHDDFGLITDYTVKVEKAEIQEVLKAQTGKNKEMIEKLRLIQR